MLCAVVRDSVFWAATTVAGKPLGRSIRMLTYVLSSYVLVPKLAVEDISV